MATSRANGSDRGRRFLLAACLIWLAFIIPFVGWQTVVYTGLPATAAEWEFARFGQSYPVINYFVLVGILCLPAIYLLMRRQGKSDRSARRRMYDLFVRGRGMMRLISGLGIGIGIAAIIVLVQLATLPDADGEPQRIGVGAANSAVLAEGPTLLVGLIRADRTALFEQNILVTSRHYRFVPLQPASSTNPRLRFFIEDNTAGAVSATSSRHLGIVRRNSLPGEVVRLYRNAGYIVTSDNYVLYTDRSAIYWPYFVILAQLSIALLILGIAYYVLSRRLRTIRSSLATAE